MEGMPMETFFKNWQLISLLAEKILKYELFLLLIRYRY